MHEPEDRNKKKARYLRGLKAGAPLIILVGLFLFATATTMAMEILGALFSIVGVLWLVHSYSMLVVIELKLKQRN